MRGLLPLLCSLVFFGLWGVFIYYDFHFVGAMFLSLLCLVIGGGFALLFLTMLYYLVCLLVFLCTFGYVDLSDLFKSVYDSDEEGHPRHPDCEYCNHRLSVQVASSQWW